MSITRKEAEKTIDYYVQRVGIGFHLDTPMSEYFSEGRQVQTEVDAAMDCLEALGIDPHEVAENSMHQHFDIATDETRSYGPRR